MSDLRLVLFALSTIVHRQAAIPVFGALNSFSRPVRELLLLLATILHVAISIAPATTTTMMMMVIAVMTAVKFAIDGVAR